MAKIDKKPLEYAKLEDIKGLLERNLHGVKGFNAVKVFSVKDISELVKDKSGFQGINNEGPYTVLVVNATLIRGVDRDYFTILHQDESPVVKAFYLLNKPRLLDSSNYTEKYTIN